MNKLSMNREKAMPCGGVQAPLGLRQRHRPHPCHCGNPKPHSSRKTVTCGQPFYGMRIMPLLHRKSPRIAVSANRAKHQVYADWVWMTCALNCMSLINAQNTTTDSL